MVCAICVVYGFYVIYVAYVIYVWLVWFICFVYCIVNNLNLEFNERFFEDCGRLYGLERLS